jgi:hypothetical protein
MAINLRRRHFAYSSVSMPMNDRKNACGAIHRLGVLVPWWFTSLFIAI